MAEETISAPIEQTKYFIEQGHQFIHVEIVKALLKDLDEQSSRLAKLVELVRLQRSAIAAMNGNERSKTLEALNNYLTANPELK